MRRCGLAFGLVICLTVVSVGDESSELSENGVARTVQEVPVPPDELRELLERGRVSFRFGGRRPSTINGMKSTGGRDQVFDAETQFRLRYEFSCRCRWSWSGDRLNVRVTYNRLKLIAAHEIWMAREPSQPFWQSKLLLHELDHVRLSSDSTFVATFNTRVRDETELSFTKEQIREILGPGDLDFRSFSGEQIRQLVNESVKHHFDQTVELVDIRYAELDRVTAHGGRPIPEDSQVATWLADAASQRPHP